MASPKSGALKGKEIVVGVTGSIAAYKAAEVVSQLVQRDAGVTVVMTLGPLASPLRTFRARFVRRKKFQRELFVIQPTSAGLLSLFRRTVSLILWPIPTRSSSSRRCSHRSARDSSVKPPRSSWTSRHLGRHRWTKRGAR